MNGTVTSFRPMMTMILLGVVACGSGRLDSEANVDNPTLKALHDADQADRTAGPDIDWPAVSLRDSSRRAQVRALLDSNEVRTSADFYHAAMVFQHGNDTAQARLAYELAERAVEIDSLNSDAKWLMAAAWDRYMMRRGDPQWYGTQFVKENADDPWRLYDIDTTRVTDGERALLGVRSLEEARARVAELNGSSP